MARGQALSKILRAYRSEARLSLNPAHNVQVRDTQIELIARTQDWLYGEYDWPHLRTERQYPGAAGQRYYDFGADFDVERIETIEFKSDGRWRPVLAGIGASHYAVYDSDLDQRAYPVQRTKIAENEQFEVWPISDQNGTAATREGYFKVTGISKLPRLAEDGDRAVLDDRLIVLFAAAETLGASGAKDANVKLKMAQTRFNRIKSSLTKKRSVRMFGIGECVMPRRRVITNYRPAGS